MLFTKIKNKYINLHIEAKAALWFTICTIIQKGILFLTSPIFTFIMSKAEYGDYSVYISWLNILTMILTLNLSAGVFNNAMHKYPDDRSRYVSSMQGLSFMLFVISLIVFITFKDPFCKNVFDMDFKVLMIIMAYILVIPGLNFWIGRSRYEYKYKFMVLISIFCSIASLLIACILVIWVKNDKAFWALVGYVVPYFIVGLILVICNFIKGKSFFNRIYWKYAFKFNIVLLPHYLSMLVLGQSDRIMIKRFIDSEHAGMYSFVYNLSSALNVFITSINQAILPWQYSKIDKLEVAPVRKLWNLVLVFIGVIMLLIVCIFPELIHYLSRNGYDEAIWCAPPIVLGIYFTALYNMFAIPEFYFESKYFITLASIIGAIINIVLNIIFIPMYGYIAAAYTTLVCYLIYAIAHGLFSTIITKRKLGVNSFYDIKAIILISLIISILTFAIMATYSNNLIRYITFGLLFIGFVLFGFILIKKYSNIKNLENDIIKNTEEN